MTWRVAVFVAIVSLVTACGGGGDSEPLTVFAAASLTEVFERLPDDARFNFAGSDELATQIREGARADVFAAASPRYPDELHAAGVVERPRVFATNRLVLIVPADNPAGVTSLADLERPGTKLVVGAEGVPVGDYTRSVLERAGHRGVLEQVVSEEEDVKGIVGKVALGEADAGFVYATDARAAAGDIRSISLPEAAGVEIRYPVALLRTTDQREQAESFVDLLLSERGRRLLRDAGFGPP